jgi:hypothetical protein
MLRIHTNPIIPRPSHEPRMVRPGQHLPRAKGEAALGAEGPLETICCLHCIGFFCLYLYKPRGN